MLLRWSSGGWDAALALTELPRRGLDATKLTQLLEAHNLHPISVAVAFGASGDRRGSLRFLKHLGLLSTYGSWIGPAGRLAIRGETISSLSPGLLLRGPSLISDCPHLEDLGEGLKCLMGPLVIRNCEALETLPAGLEVRALRPIDDEGKPIHPALGANLVLEGCPRLIGFRGTHLIEGRIKVHLCPKWQGPYTSSGL
jgi:hypothetical protein